MTDNASAKLASAAAHAYVAGRLDDALEALDAALRLTPDDADTIQFRAAVLHGLGRLEAALAEFDRALANRPDFFEALYNRGNTLLALRKFTEAVASYDAALALRPLDTGALNNRGRALMALYRPDAALASFEQAAALAPDSAEFIHNCGAALQLLGQIQPARARFEQALARQPDDRLALANYASLLRSTARYAESAACLARLLALAPDTPFALGQMLHAKLLHADWAGLDTLAATIDQAVHAGRPAIPPFEYLAISDLPAALHRAAQIYAAYHFPPNPRAFPRKPARPDPRQDRPRQDPPRQDRRKQELRKQDLRKQDRRIRLGYVSSDYRNHATAQLIVELFECHDRSRFTLIGFDTAGDDASPIRRRLDAAFDEMIDISGLGSTDAADAVAAMGIDILINLNGYSGRQRNDVFAQRPASVQVNYLGFPGGMGADYIDYILGDRFVTPPEHAAWFSERIVQLPDSYQVNDRKRVIAAHIPSRAEAGLPETGFVFCCFNHTFKILPNIFDIWMGLLRDIPGSVLWLLGDNPAAEDNLCHEAAARDVDPARLIFAPRLQLDEHLARHACADLFLDTLPTNAHTTASDALWAGLPVLTCLGGSFSGRVAASLLHAAGLAELVADSLADYAARARRLVAMPNLLADIRSRLIRNRDTMPLFDTARICLHIESAYTTMWARHQRGLKPAAFTVAPLARSIAATR